MSFCNFFIVSLTGTKAATTGGSICSLMYIHCSEVMHIFGLPQGPQVGFFIKNLQNAIRECDIDDTREAAIDYLYELGRRAGIEPVNPPYDQQQCTT